MAKYDELNLPRLCGAIERSRLSLRFAREEARFAVEQYCGSHCFENVATEDVPVNMIALYQSVVGQALIPKNPRMMISTFQQENKPTVKTLESWVNNKIEDIDLATTLKRNVVDALFSLGINYVALSTPADAARYAWKMNAGEPYSCPIHLDDFVFDNHARDFSEAAFVGHRFRVPLDAIRDDSKNYNKSRKDLVASTDPAYNREGDERVSTLGRGLYGVNIEEYEDMVDLWSVWLPRHKMIVLLPADTVNSCYTGEYQGDVEPLAAIRWLGPYCGPYHFLAYGTVPGNAMPKSPIMNLIDLHLSINNIYRKLIRQAQRQKSVLPFQGGTQEDADRARTESDGGVVRFDGGQPMKEVSFGGPNAQNFGLGNALRELFKEMAGNLDSMGGLNPQASTLGQERLLAENSSKAIADLQGTTLTFITSVVNAMCWYWWHDPYKVMRVKLPVGTGTNMEIVRKVTPGQRMATSWDDLQLKLDPYSLQHQTPSSRLQFLTQTLTQVCLPMMPLLQKSGVGIDINKFLQIASKYGDCPELAEILTISEPPQDNVQSQGGAETPAGPAQTTRTYNRVSQPGRTAKGDSRNMTNALMGVDVGGSPNGNGQAM